MTTLVASTRAKIEAPGAPIWSWLPESEIEDSAMTQIKNIAALPCAVHVAVMPDAHTGYGMPIGTALATRQAVVPYATPLPRSSLASAPAGTSTTRPLRSSAPLGAR